MNYELWNTKGYTKLYYEIVDAMIDEISHHQSITYEDVLPFIEGISKGILDLTLLYGTVQSGKSKAVIIIMFILNCKFHKHTVFLTKNLDCIRQDIYSKIEHGFLKDIIIDVCQRYDINKEDMDNYFMLHPCVYTEHRLVGRYKHNVFIFLMQKNNYECLLKNLHNSLQDKKPADTVFIIDEAHEMITETNKYVTERGLTEDFTNRVILHILENYRDKKQCSILKITATPFRNMSSDITCYPKQILKLRKNPPFESAIYYGLQIDNDHILENVIVNEYESEKLLDRIEEILNTPRSVIHNNKVEVPLILITTERLNIDQEEILEKIQSKFADRVFPRIMNQDKTNRYSTTLEDFFKKSNLTPKICKEGALILIGKACLSTGITIKPPLGQEDCSLKVEDRTYYVSGITDQFVNVTASIEYQMQLCRLFGWFPKGHRSRLWVPKNPKNYIKYYTETVPDIINQFIMNYDGVSGPKSIKRITAKSEIHGICGSKRDDPYRKTSRTIINTRYTANEPEQGIKFETIIHDIKADLPDNKLCDLFKRTKLQREIHKQIKDETGIDNFNMTYEKKRYNALLKSIIDPREENENNKGRHFKVNAYISGKNGLESKLKDIKLVEFKDKWDQRKTLGDHPDESFYFWDGFNWVILNGKEKEYKLREDLIDLTYSDNYEIVLKNHIKSLLKEIIKDKKKKRPMNSWNLVRRVCRKLYGTGDSKFSSKYNKMLKSDKKKVEEVNNLLLRRDICEDEIISLATDLLVPLFREDFQHNVITIKPKQSKEAPIKKIMIKPIKKIVKKKIIIKPKI